jgi:CheY-like chemotaxis protein
MAFQILVVDNQREVSKAIRAGVQSLGSEFVVATAMSGEEALLEARLRKFDLLISEVRLTGMSGVELVRKLRASKPDLKAILVSSSTDRYIRREVADVGIENLLQKPIEMVELLNEVQGILGVGSSPSTPVQEEKPPVLEPMSISDRLAVLRQDLDASLALLMSDTGEILMQAGNFQSMDMGAEISSLTAVFSAGHKISRLLGLTVPANLYTFRGSKHDLVMTHVGESHALLIGTLSAGATFTHMERFNQIIWQATHDLLATLTDMGVPFVAREESASDEPLIVPTEDKEEIQEVFEVDQGLEALFKVGDKAKTSGQTDLDSFWEVTSAEDTGIFASSDALSYEQARQLGLAPDEQG